MKLDEDGMIEKVRMITADEPGGCLTTEEAASLIEPFKNVFMRYKKPGSGYVVGPRRHRPQ